MFVADDSILKMPMVGITFNLFFEKHLKKWLGNISPHLAGNSQDNFEPRMRRPSFISL